MDASNVHTELTAVENAIRSEVVQFVCVSRQGAMWMPIFSGLAQWHAKSFTSPGGVISSCLELLGNAGEDRVRLTAIFRQGEFRAGLDAGGNGCVECGCGDVCVGCRGGEGGEGSGEEEE